MGADYDHAVQSEDKYLVMRSFEELAEKIQKENDYWTIKIAIFNKSIYW